MKLIYSYMSKAIRHAHVKPLAYASVLLLFPIFAIASVGFDSFDLSCDSRTEGMMLILCGVGGVIACRDHGSLTNEYTANTNMLLKWMFRVALVFTVLPVITQLFGIHTDQSLSKMVWTGWALGKAAQGIYISGVAAVKNGF